MDKEDIIIYYRELLIDSSFNDDVNTTTNKDTIYE